MVSSPANVLVIGESSVMSADAGVVKIAGSSVILDASSSTSSDVLAIDESVVNVTVVSVVARLLSSSLAAAGPLRFSCTFQVSGNAACTFAGLRVVIGGEGIAEVAEPFLKTLSVLRRKPSSVRLMASLIGEAVVLTRFLVIIRLPVHSGVVKSLYLLTARAMTRLAGVVGETTSLLGRYAPPLNPPSDFPFFSAKRSTGLALPSDPS